MAGTTCVARVLSHPESARGQAFSVASPCYDVSTLHPGAERKIQACLFAPEPLATGGAKADASRLLIRQREELLLVYQCWQSMVATPFYAAA